MFFSAGIVFLTLVINATTTGFLVKKLDLTKESDTSKRMLRNVLDQHDERIEFFIQKWKTERSSHGDSV